MKSNRRQFMALSAVSVASLVAARVAYAQPMLGENEPQALALGYKEDAKEVDRAKFAKYAEGQRCDNCQLYTVKDATTGLCSIFPGKLVTAAGWCNLWVKMAG